jgi:hypothetical protein
MCALHFVEGCLVLITGLSMPRVLATSHKDGQSEHDGKIMATQAVLMRGASRVARATPEDVLWLDEESDDDSDGQDSEKSGARDPFKPDSTSFKTTRVGDVAELLACNVLLVFRTLVPGFVWLVFRPSDNTEKRMLENWLSLGALIVGLALVYVSAAPWIRRLGPGFYPTRLLVPLCWGLVICLDVQSIVCQLIAGHHMFGFKTALLLGSCEAGVILVIMVNPFHTDVLLSLLGLFGREINAAKVPVWKKFLAVANPVTACRRFRCIRFSTRQELSVLNAAVAILESVQHHPNWPRGTSTGGWFNSHAPATVALTPVEASEAAGHEGGVCDSSCNYWPYVLVDILTVRHMSSMIFVGVAVNTMELAYFVSLLIQREVGETNEQWWFLKTAWGLLLFQTFLGIMVWVFAGIQLIMNNPFTPRKISIALLFVMVLNCIHFSLIMLGRFFGPLDNPTAIGVVFTENQFDWFGKHWLRFLMVVTQLCVLIALFVRMVRPEHSSDYLQTELRALHYTSTLLKPLRPRSWPQPGTHVQVRLDGMWRDGKVRHKHANGLVGVYVEGGVETVSQEVTVLSKRCRPMGESSDSVHKVHTQARMQRRFMDFLRPIIIVPPVLSLASVMGVVLTVWLSCSISSVTSSGFRHILKFQEGVHVIDEYIWGTASCTETGTAFSMALDFDSSGNLSIGELPFVAGNVYVPYSKITDIICGVEATMNGTKSITAKIKDGTMTGEDLRHFIEVVYHQVLSNSVGTSYENNLTQQIINQRNNAERQVNNIIENGINTSESQLESQLHNGINMGKAQLDQLYQKVCGLGGSGWAVCKMLSFGYGINQGSDLIGPDIVQQIESPERQKQVMDQALNMLLTKMYGKNTTITANSVLGGVSKLTPQDIQNFAVKMSMNAMPKNITLSSTPPWLLTTFQILEPTMYWVGNYWTLFGLRALYFIIACCNVSSDVFVLYIVGRMFRKYHTLMQSMQEGSFAKNHQYEATRMRNSFGACTYLPGTFVFSALMAYFAFYIFLFAWLAFIITIVVLLFIPATRPGLLAWFFNILFYIGVYFGIIYGIKLVIVEKFCIEEGEVVRPRVLSLCLTILMVYNFIVGSASAVFRVFFILSYAIINSFFIDGTILPDDLIRWDTGYSSFLASTYTWYERLNPVRKSFITLLMPSVHMAYAPEHEGSELSVKARRVRNRFNLAITLFRNPELIEYRRRGPNQKDDEDDCCHRD